MPISYPATRKEVIDRVKADVQSELPTSDPFLRNSFISSIAVGMGGAAFDLNVNQQNLQNELFMDTAEGDYLQRWATPKNLTKTPATSSSGSINVTGTAGVTILINAELQTDSGIKYKTTEAKTIATRTLTISSITRSGTTATATTSTAHNLANNSSVTISGAVQTAYNGTKTVIVTGETTFTYTVSGSPATPATGTITGQVTDASIAVVSEDTGANTNLSNGAKLIFVSPPTGANSAAYTQYYGLTGGTDLESDVNYRDRILYIYRNPISNFSVSDITVQCRKVSGVTRVKVYEITPAIGQVTILFVRDNDTDIIPTPDEVTAVKNNLLLIKPANVDPDDVIVSAPTPISVSFVFTTISPDTATMRTAITNSLTQLFKDNLSIGQTLTKNAYIAAIYETIDTVTGDKLASFTLATPSTDITITATQIAVLSGVTFS